MSLEKVCSSLSLAFFLFFFQDLVYHGGAALAEKTASYFFYRRWPLLDRNRIHVTSEPLMETYL